ncbi:MAG: toll/interleukin-1 receptor domain-containing protein [Candidatus Methanospirareceae archaeon]
MKVFISHSSVDKKFVQRLATDLRTREGIDAWFDQWEINPGDRIPERLEEGLSEAENFILVLSPDSVNSQWVKYEHWAWLTMQIEEEKHAKEESRPPARRLIPVLYRDCQKPAFLQPIHHVKITDQEYEGGFKQLVNAIMGTSEKPPLKEEGYGAPVAPEPNVPRRIYVLTLLKSLLPTQFDEVVFNYNMPDAYLPTTAPQAQKAIVLIRWAEQREGKAISELLDTIYKFAPHFRR